MKPDFKSFLGKGFAFPMQIDGKGHVEMSSADKSIRESVYLILGTPLGERLMRPDFGCAIHDLVFHPVNANTCSTVSTYVKNSLTKWEKRIIDLSVQAYPSPSDENVILIDISYVVRSTNTLDNLVYPFFMRREQDL